MKLRLGHVSLCMTTVLVLLLAEWLLARHLAARDPLASVIQRDPVAVMLVLGALAVRLFLYLLAPAWLLYVAGSIVIDAARMRTFRRGKRLE
jgi:hypothetical protein